MAKIIAPFQIKGTLDDLNFYVDQDGKNIVRMKGKTGISSEQYKKLPSIHKVRMHGTEFGRCTKKSINFRGLAKSFNDKAKEGSYAGRVNKLLFEIMKQDTTKPLGDRMLENGLKTDIGKQLLLYFESNKLRPISKVFKTKEKYQMKENELIINNLKPKTHLDWPTDATHVHFSIATTSWDCENDSFETNYSEEIIVAKEDKRCNITLSVIPPINNNLILTFFYIGFSIKDQLSYKHLHRKNNTATIIKVSS